MFVFTGGEALFAFLYENYPSLNLTIVTNISIYILYFTWKNQCILHLRFKTRLLSLLYFCYKIPKTSSLCLSSHYIIQETT